MDLGAASPAGIFYGDSRIGPNLSEAINSGGCSGEHCRIPIELGRLLECMHHLLSLSILNAD